MSGSDTAEKEPMEEVVDTPHVDIVDKIVNIVDIVEPEEQPEERPEEQSEEQPPPGPLPFAEDGDSKADIRKKVWDYLESNNIAIFPRPVLNRIPNFKGSAASCDKAADLDVFRQAETIKINPDKPQEQARFRTLETGKSLLVPTPRLREGLFNRVQPQNSNKGMLKFCSTSQGVRRYSTPVGLEMKVQVDLVILGSVAVSPDGLRIGKGEGYADLEFGMMAAVGAVNKDTIVVSCVHDSQVMDLQESLFEPFDVPVDFICTPTRVLECSRRPKPAGILWSLLHVEKFAQIPILKVLREQQREEGKDVTLKDANEDEVGTALEEAAVREEERQAKRAQRLAEREQGEGDRDRRNRRRRPGGKFRDQDGEAHSGEEEHADGEGSPPRDPRRRQLNRRRRMRNRRRNTDSEAQNSEGERTSPALQQDDSGKENAGPRKRKPRQRRQWNRQRDSKGETLSENEDYHTGKASPDGKTDQRRPPRRPRNRPYPADGDRDGQQQDRRPRKYAYSNRRPRNDEAQHSDEGEGAYEAGRGERRRRDKPRRDNNLPMVYIGSLPRALRVSDFKAQVRNKDVNPLRVLWRGSNGHVFMIFQTMEETEDALAKLDNLIINEKEVKVALAKRTERKQRGSPQPDDLASDLGDLKLQNSSQGLQPTDPPES